MQAHLVRIIGLFCWKKSSQVTILESAHKRPGERQRGSLMSILWKVINNSKATGPESFNKTLLPTLSSTNASTELRRVQVLRKKGFVQDTQSCRKHGGNKNTEKNKGQCFMQGQSCFYGVEQYDQMTCSNINHATVFLKVKWSNKLYLEINVNTHVDSFNWIIVIFTAKCLWPLKRMRHLLGG